MSSGKAPLPAIVAIMKQLSEKKVQSIVMKVSKEMKEKNTPLPGNLCHNCNGHVVRNVSSFFRGTIFYSLPKCESCGRVYLYAENAPRVGGDGFMRKIHEPMCARN